MLRFIMIGVLFGGAWIFSIVLFVRDNKNSPIGKTIRQRLGKWWKKKEKSIIETIKE